MTASTAVETAPPAAQLPLPPEVPEWVMVARTGAWLGHPAMPEVVTPECLAGALDYFNRHHAAHGADLVIDYHHSSVVAPREGAQAPAAGWIRQMELRLSLIHI